MRTRGILTLLIAVPLLTLAAIVALIALSARTPEPAPKPEPAVHVSLTDGQRRQRTETALAFEHASRDWGTDPAVIPTGRAGDPTLIDRMRTPAPDHAALDRLTVMRVGEGPAARSPECGAASDAMCAAYPTMLDHVDRLNWTVGARIDGTPETKVNDDGTVTVTGRSRVIAWSGPTGAPTRVMPDGSAWWSLTPLTGVQSWEDTLSFDDRGLVTARAQTTRSSWLADPWFAAWDGDVAQAATGLEDATRADIPMPGGLPACPGLDTMPGDPLVPNRVDEPSTLWSDIDAAHGGGAQQEGPSQW